ncbi:MAG: GNAT superfamily N-acetyltransferase [Paracoccaceae bacterium]|jgi:GNAT superfamily N-acetyltransferase
MNVVRPILHTGNASQSVGSDLNIREATEADLDVIRELIVAIGNDERNRSYDHWRFFAGPYGNCPSVIAMDGARAVAFYTVWPVKLKLGNEIVSGAQSMDTMTHPDYRGRGLFIKLAMACYEICAERGYEALYGFPNSNSYPGFLRRLNWDHTGDIVHWVRTLKLSKYRAVPKAVGPMIDAASFLLPSGKIGDAQISFEIPDATSLQTLINLSSDEKNTCRVHRDLNWFSWRYSPAAEKDFEWVCVHRGGKLVGLGIWGMQNASWGQSSDGRARIGELMGETPQDIEAVLATIIKRARGRSAIVLESYCNMEPVVRAFRRAGFFRYKSAPFIVRGLTARNLDGNIHNHDAWRIAGGDWDGI